MQAIEIHNVKHIAFWNPDVDASSATEQHPVLLIEEDEVCVTLEFPSREALRRFIAKLVAL